MKTVTLLITLFLCIPCMAQPGKKVKEKRTYNNPVIDYSLPDPTIIKADDGYFYLYATEDIRNLPIHRSANLVDWEFVGTAFTDSTRPTFQQLIWAPDIRKIGDKYVLYYANSSWGEEHTNGIGVAWSLRPEGPFTDAGKLFLSDEIEVMNSIDAFYMEENGRKYLFWGSWHGLWGVELTDDGLALQPNTPKIPIAGNGYEAGLLHKHGDYYYLFASTGSCCEGLKSTYTTVVGRSKNLFGPYVNRKGELMLSNHHEVVIEKNKDRCQLIAQKLENGIVLCGDGTDIDLLTEEGIAEADVVICITEDDKLNLLLALMAKHLGAKKTIVRVARNEYVELMEKVGVDIVLSSRLLSSGEVLRFVRKGGIVSVSLLEGAKAEALEIILPDDCEVIGKSLKDIKLPRACLVCAVVHDNEAVVPNGNTVLYAGDRIIIFVKSEFVKRVMPFFESRG